MTVSKQYTSAEKETVIACLLVQTTCVVWFITKLITWRLWTIERLFPTAPPFDFLTAPAVVHWIIFVPSLLLLLALVFKPANKLLLASLLVLELISCLFDQSRWQPWEYQFVFIIFIALVNYGQHRRILLLIAFVTVSTYIYSGSGKFNQGFLVVFWDNLFLKGFLHLSKQTVQNPYLHYSGYLVALAEFIFGAGLLFRKTQKLFAWALILMHVIILLMAGPAGLNYNESVWPWNVLMMVHLYLLFIYTETAIELPVLMRKWNMVVLICWGFLPALNHTIGWWDNFLSSRLFAGVQPQMMFCVKDSTEIKQLLPYARAYRIKNLCDSNAMQVNVQSWSMKEMKSPAYIEERAFKMIANKWLEEHKGSNTKAILYYYEYGGGIRIVSEQQRKEQ